VQQSFAISCQPGPQQQTRRTLLQQSVAGTDTWTDGRIPYCYIDPAAYYASSVDKIAKWMLFEAFIEFYFISHAQAALMTTAVAHCCRHLWKICQ